MVEGVDRFTSYDLSVKTEAAYAVLLALIFTAMRWTANYLVLGTPFVNQKKSMLKRIERVFEEVWLSILSTGLLVLSWTIFLNNDVGASITNTLPCIHNWPNNSVTVDVVYLLRIESGYYLHQTTRGATASGVPIDTLMFYHHIATLLIIAFGYWKNMLLLGVLTVAIFNISNPFLHASKITHIMEWALAKQVLFSAFAVAFFVSRVIMLPCVIMKIGYIDAYKENYVSFGETLILIGNILMGLLYALQIYWMAKIVRVFQGGRTGATPTKSSESKTVFTDGKPVKLAKDE